MHDEVEAALAASRDACVVHAILRLRPQQSARVEAEQTVHAVLAEPEGRLVRRVLRVGRPNPARGTQSLVEPDGFVAQADSLKRFRTNT